MDLHFAQRNGKEQRIGVCGEVVLLHFLRLIFESVVMVVFGVNIGGVVRDDVLCQLIRCVRVAILIGR